jgi:hypothetical protein
VPFSLPMMRKTYDSSYRIDKLIASLFAGKRQRPRLNPKRSLQTASTSGTTAGTRAMMNFRR